MSRRPDAAERRPRLPPHHLIDCMAHAPRRSQRRPVAALGEESVSLPVCRLPSSSRPTARQARDPPRTRPAPRAPARS
eukprot:747611-Hanusia_phi.AAC.3